MKIKKRLYKKEISQGGNYTERKNKRRRDIKIKGLYIEINYMERE